MLPDVNFFVMLLLLIICVLPLSATYHSANNSMAFCAMREP